MVYIFIYDYLGEAIHGWPFWKVPIFDTISSTEWRMWAWQIRTTPTIISISEVNYSLGAIRLYFAVHYRFVRLNFIRSGKTAFYGLICQLQTNAVLLLARVFIRWLLTTFHQIFYPRFFCYWELWPNSAYASDRNLTICGLHSLIPLKHPSLSKMLYYELNKYICIHEFLVVSHWSLTCRRR